MFVGIELFIVFLYYPLLFSGWWLLFLVLVVCVLSLLFLNCLTRVLSIWLIFSKNHFLVLLIFLYWFSIFNCIEFCSNSNYFFLLTTWDLFCSFFSWFHKMTTYMIYFRSFILMYAFDSINFPLCTAFAVSHIFNKLYYYYHFFHLFHTTCSS